jgi:hypothetical protein
MGRLPAACSNLQRTIAVVLHSLYLGNTVWLCLDHSYGDGITLFREDTRHAALAANKTHCHLINLASTAIGRRQSKTVSMYVFALCANYGWLALFIGLRPAKQLLAILGKPLKINPHLPPIHRPNFQGGIGLLQGICAFAAPSDTRKGQPSSETSHLCSTA